MRTCFCNHRALPWLLVVLLASATLRAGEPLGTTNPIAVKAGDFLRANMDTSVSPGDDFFEYANGGWLKRNPIPASESAWGIGKVVQEELYSRLRQINEKAVAASNPPGSEQKKIADFWSTAMDAAKAEQLGLAPLQTELKRIDAVKNAQDALDVAFALQPIGVDAFFGFAISQDEKNSEVMSVHLAQGGLGLPDRDFYFNPEEGVAHIREEYVAHLARTFKLLGREDAAARAAATNVMAFETALARPRANSKTFVTR